MTTSAISIDEVKFIITDKPHAQTITNLIIVHAYESLNKRYAPHPESMGRRLVEDINLIICTACDSGIGDITDYPSDLQTLLSNITENFHAEIANITENKLLPYSRLTVLTLSGPKMLQESFERVFWYPLGISKLNPELWCKHWTLKRECRTCKIITLFLLKRDARIAFPPKDILKLIFDRLPKEHLVALRDPPPFQTCLDLIEAGPLAKMPFDLQAQPLPGAICGIHFNTDRAKYPLPLICCQPAKHLTVNRYWVCEDHLRVTQEA